MGRLHPIPPPSVRDGPGGPRITQLLLLSQLPPHSLSWTPCPACRGAGWHQPVVPRPLPGLEWEEAGGANRFLGELWYSSQAGMWDCQVALEATKLTLSGNLEQDRHALFVVSPLFPWGTRSSCLDLPSIGLEGSKGSMSGHRLSNCGGWRGRGKCIYFSQGIV